jgi:hypothetical protein
MALKTQPHFFFVICSTPSKKSLDSSIISNFNFELEIKVGDNVADIVRFILTIKMI